MTQRKLDGLRYRLYQCPVSLFHTGKIMAITNQQRVGKGLELLRTGLGPFVEREIQAAIKANTVRMESIRRFADDPLLAQKPIAQWDVSGLLKLTWETWNDVFRNTLGFAERSLVS